MSTPNDQAGVRHIDTATWYENEAPCKRAIESFIAKHNVPRSDIWYTTKLRAPTSYEATLKAIDYSIAHAPEGKIDLYLAHSAIGGPKLREASWRAMEQRKQEGKLNSIGVSNWGVKHIEEIVRLVEDESKPEIKTLPALNQVGEYRAREENTRALQGARTETLTDPVYVSSRSNRPASVHD